MGMLILRGVIAGLIVVGVSLLAKGSPRLGAFLLTLPIVSIVAFAAAWQKDRDIAALSRMARETLVLVPLGLPFFLPLAFAQRLGLGFIASMFWGLAIAGVTIGLWLWLGPESL